MKKNKISFKLAMGAIAVGIIAIVGIAYYMELGVFGSRNPIENSRAGANMARRNAERAEEDFEYDSSSLMDEEALYFRNVLTEAYTDLESVEGDSLEVVGYVYRDENLPEGQVILARDMIFCCPDDAEPTGFLVEDQELSQFEDGQWLAVNGKLGSMLYVKGSREEELPSIDVESIETVEAPAEGYIYP